MGIKKGLKSLTMPIARIADAIEAGDEKMLTTLPAVGKRMAQLIVAELNGKLTRLCVGRTGADKVGRSGVWRFSRPRLWKS